MNEYDSLLEPPQQKSEYDALLEPDKPANAPAAAPQTNSYAGRGEFAPQAGATSAPTLDKAVRNPVLERVDALAEGAGLPTSLEGLKEAGRFLVRSPIQDVKDIVTDLAKVPSRIANFGQTVAQSPAATVARDPLSPDAFRVYGTAAGMLLPAFQKLTEPRPSGLQETVGRIYGEQPEVPLPNPEATNVPDNLIDKSQQVPALNQDGTLPADIAPPAKEPIKPSEPGAPTEQAASISQGATAAPEAPARDVSGSETPLATGEGTGGGAEPQPAGAGVDAAARAIEAEGGLQLNKNGEPAAFIHREADGTYRISDTNGDAISSGHTPEKAIGAALEDGYELDPRALKEYEKPNAEAGRASDEPSDESSNEPSRPPEEQGSNAPSEGEVTPLQAAPESGDGQVNGRARVGISIPDSPVGVPDLIDFTKEQGGVHLPRKSERTSLHDDASEATAKFYNGRLAGPRGAIKAGEMAQMAYDAGLIKDAKPTTYWEALHDNIERRPRTREQIRNEQLRLVEEERNARLRPGENQGDLLSKQTEDLTLVGEKGIDYAARQAEADATAKANTEAAALTDSQQAKLFEPSFPTSSKTTDVRDAAMRNADMLQERAPTGQELGITPQASPFIKQDVARVVSGGLKNFVKGYRQIRNVLSPASAGPLAERAAGIVRENAAELARKHEIAYTQLREASKAFSKTDNTFNLDVIDRLENGKAQATPQLDTFAKEIRRQLDDRVKQVQAINPNALQNVIEDYFAHIWTKESVAKLQGNLVNVPQGNAWGEVFGKRPLEGSKSFLKQRTIPTTVDGVALGLEPVSWNPVDLQLLKLHEMDRYIMGQQIMSEFKDAGLAQFVQAGAKADPGYAPINDKIARVLAPRDWKIVDANGKEMPGQKVMGSYYAPEDAARVINNYLSPGLRGNVLYDGFRWVGNNMNMVQLGISFYHATFTSLDAATSAFSLGLEQIARSGGSPKEIGVGIGNMLKGTGEAITVGGGLVENLWRGNKFLREYSRPGTTNADLAKIVDAAVAGGARVRMDTFYKTGAVHSFFEAIRQGNYPGAALRAPFAGIEAAAKPLMEHGVPMMKAGVISQQLRYELSKLPANATREDVRIVAGRVIDSVDNRMGQMIYDNLFWNKVLKDGLMASVRSVGWNVGDIREIGGGIVDTLSSPARVYRSLTGRTTPSSNPVFTKHMSYVAGLPIIVGTVGAIYQYLMTGEAPRDIQDLYMPRTGRQKADGSEERVMLPTYMKDILPLAVAGKRGLIPFMSRLAQMALNKAHPLISMMSHMWHNQDYYGNQIRNEDDDFVTSVKKESDFALKQFKPFSVQGVEQREGGVKEKAQAAIGIMPAPGELTRSSAMQMIHEINLRNRPAGGYTEAQQQKRADARSAHEGEDMRPKLFKRLSKADRARVLELATPEEASIFQSP